MKKILKKIYQRTPIYRVKRIRELNRLLAEGLPCQLESIVLYLITGELDPEIKVFQDEIEKIRIRIAQRGDEVVEIYYSPKPGSAGEADSDGLKPEPGEMKRFTMRQIAETGKNYRWGTVLHMLATNFRKEIAFELGSCAGISACYIGTSPTMKKVVSVEGSTELAKIASESVSLFGDKINIVNSLFEDAIDSILPTIKGGIDFAFIDGHHEKIATIHYFNRMLPYLKPGALVVFDDISWSYDMREGWNELMLRPEFEQVFDLGTIGVCILNKQDMIALTKQWDLRDLLDKRFISKPKGWQN